MAKEAIFRRVRAIRELTQDQEEEEIVRKVSRGIRRV